MVKETTKLVYFICFLALIGTIISFSEIHQNFLIMLLKTFFNYVTSAISFGWAIMFISIFFILLFVIIIATISTPISKIGVYYKAKPFHGWREPIFTNSVEVFLNYLVLTIPLYFTIIYLLNTANFFVASDASANVTNVIYV